MPPLRASSSRPGPSQPPTRAGARSSRPSHSSSSVSRGQSSSRRDEGRSNGTSRRQEQRYGSVSGTSSSRRRNVIADDEDDNDGAEENDEEDGEDGEDGGGDEGDEEDGNNAMQEDAEDDDEDVNQDEDLKVKKATLLPMSDSVKKLVKALGKKEMHKKANDLVRLALFSEYRRQPIKRADITQRVLGKSASRAFPYVFNRAQQTLRKTYCYELVELRAKGAENEPAATQPATKENDGKGKKRDREENAEGDAATKSSSNRAYVLRSILPQTVIEAMTQADELQSYAPASQGPSTEKGPMLDWRTADGQLGSMGLTYLILSFILLNGRVLADDQFRSYLARLGLNTTSILPASLRPDSVAVETQLNSAQQRGQNRTDIANDAVDTIARPSSLQKLIQQLQNQQYLERTETNLLTGTTQSRGRGGGGGGRNGGEGDGDQSSNTRIEWKWGPRAEVEIGETAVAEFVSTIYVDGLPVEDEGEEEEKDGEPTTNGAAGRRSQARARSSTQGRNTSTQQNGGATQTQRERQSATIRREIERAAGSQLVG